MPVNQKRECPVRLRIIDKPTASLESDTVEVQFTRESSQRTYIADYFPSPFSTGLKSSLEWYFQAYQQQAEGSHADRDVVTKLLQLGQQMSDNLLGEDHELMAIAEQITDVGINELQVDLVSQRFAFFDELWESMILPESSFMLSGAAASFTRRFDANSTDDVLQLGYSASHPLQCLTIFDEQAQSLPETQQMHIESFGFKSVLCHSTTTLQNSSMQAVDAQHGVVYLCADIHFQEDGSFTLGSGHSNESQWLAQLSAWQTHLVLINAKFYSADNQLLDASMGLAWVAQRLINTGINNVVGLGQYTDAWTVQQNISAILQALVQGVSVSRAVVEARKSLQRNTQSQVLTNQGVQFQSWSLLQHYQSQDVRFITEGIEVEAAEQSTFYNELRRSLHGFVSECIFPTAFPVLTGNALPVIQSLQTSALTQIQGASGCGKTYTLHQAATAYIAQYLQNNPSKVPEPTVDLTGAEQPPKAFPERQAFYFDYKLHRYSEKDVTDMLAPTVGIDPRGDEMSASAVWDKLNGSESLFVFDNVDIDDSVFHQLITHLQSLSCKVIVSGDVELEQATSLTLRELETDEMRALVAHQLRLSGISQSIDLEVLKLIDVCRGNPFLAVNLAKQLRHKTEQSQQGKSAQALIKQVAEFIDWDNSETPIVAQYMQWQWQKLPAVSQAWLGLLATVPDVLLEMFSIVAGRATPDFVELVKTLNGGVEPEDSQLDFGLCLQQFVAAGFATRFPHGRMLRKSTLIFIQQQTKDLPVLQKHQDDLTVMLAKVVAASLLKLLPQIQRKPDQQIVQTLLAHRDIWARQLEILWAAEQYGYFLGLMQQLTAFLNGYQLGQEMTAWSAKLLLAKQVKHIEFDNMQRIQSAFEYVNAPDEKGARQGLERLVAAATIANQAADQLGEQALITKDESEQLAQIYEQMVSAWEAALASFIDITEQKWAVLAQHGLQMLVMWYRRSKAWEKLHQAATTCQQIYQQYEAWPRVITATQQVLEACVHLKNESGIANAEKLILRDVPYDKFPPGTFLQNAMQIVIGRVSRQDDVAAQALVDELRAQPEAKPLETLLDAVQADIHLMREEFSEALKLLLSQWHELIKQSAIEASISEEEADPQGPNAAMLKEKLLEIKAKIGVSEYQQCAESVELPLSCLPNEA